MFDGDAPAAGDSNTDDVPVPAPKPAADDDGLLDTIADGAGEVAKKTGGVLWTMFVRVLKEFYRYVIVVFLPIPVRYLARKQLAFRDFQTDDGKGQLEFYSQPNFVTTIHLIWVGWVVAAFFVALETRCVFTRLQTSGLRSPSLRLRRASSSVGAMP